jgi:CheY-like chemotaxis protein
MTENKILVVDDEDFQREWMQKVISKLGYAVTVVDSAEAALSVLEKEQFPLIISDLILLDMDGVEFCREIRASNSEAYVIALTGHGELYDREKLKLEGFNDYLSKPIRVGVIKQAIEEGFDAIKRRAEAPGK